MGKRSRITCAPCTGRAGASCATPRSASTASRAAKPEDVVYQLDYNEDGATRHGDEYFQLFRDCGWEFVQYFAGFSYFRKCPPRSCAGDEGIFSDAASRLDMMKRMLIARLLPALVILLRLCPVLRGTT